MLEWFVCLYTSTLPFYVNLIFDLVAGYCVGPTYYGGKYGALKGSHGLSELL